MAWVVGVLLWFLAALVMGIAICFSLLGWRIAFGFAFAALFLTILAGMGCVLWFFAESLGGRVTPWRKE